MKDNEKRKWGLEKEARAIESTKQWVKRVRLGSKSDLTYCLCGTEAVVRVLT